MNNVQYKVRREDLITFAKVVNIAKVLHAVLVLNDKALSRKDKKAIRDADLIIAAAPWRPAKFIPLYRNEVASKKATHAAAKIVKLNKLVKNGG